MDNDDRLNSLLWNADIEDLKRLETPEFIEVATPNSKTSLILFRFKKSPKQVAEKRPAA